MAIGETESLGLNIWLVVLILVELPEVYGLLVENKAIEGCFSTLRNARPEKRLWSMVLLLLVIARVQALLYPFSPGVMTNCAVVHVLEAVVFGNEMLIHKGRGSNIIYAIIVANAVWFVSLAVRI
mmetsp:Transcript_777/g.947  ORF Transcript_777/g.947 Transcript_777/m.947 type:complete len:125 (-) Transcript_777:179-553(-)